MTSSDSEGKTFSIKDRPEVDFSQIKTQVKKK
jgi:hypothetical protein